MTERKVTFALKRINNLKKQKCDLEALLRTYQLNVGLVRYMLDMLAPETVTTKRKAKEMVQDLRKLVQGNRELSTIIPRKNLKGVKPWLLKMDKAFKDLNYGKDVQAKKLQEESEKVFGILNISSSKLFIRHRPERKTARKRSTQAHMLKKSKAHEFRPKSLTAS